MFKVPFPSMGNKFYNFRNDSPAHFLKIIWRGNKTFHLLYPKFRMKTYPVWKIQFPLYIDVFCFSVLPGSSLLDILGSSLDYDYSFSLTIFYSLNCVLIFNHFPELFMCDENTSSDKTKQGRNTWSKVCLMENVCG